MFPVKPTIFEVCYEVLSAGEDGGSDLLYYSRFFTNREDAEAFSVSLPVNCETCDVIEHEFDGTVEGAIRAINSAMPTP